VVTIVSPTLIVRKYIAVVSTTIDAIAIICETSFNKSLGGFLYNSVGAATFLISAIVIFAVFVMSFKLLKWKEA
jgi:hypothetical protein